MRGDVRIRKVPTSSGATAVQVVRYIDRKCIVIRHMGSAHTDEELQVLWQSAEFAREELCQQPSLFPLQRDESQLLHVNHLSLTSVTHLFAHRMLRQCGELCGLGEIPSVYQDLALMRIIEPTSKLRTLELLQQYFGISYPERTVYRLLPKLIDQKQAIEEAAYKTATHHFEEAFALVLYDVTTLYFESHEPDDELKARGFSKDDKSRQPQVVVGLLVTSQGFPLMHEVYKGNTFEGHTMLSVVNQFQSQHPHVNPIIVADAAMLSQDNMSQLEDEGYSYIVGARLANTTASFIEKIDIQMERKEGNLIRLPYPKRTYDVIYSYSEKRFRKDEREMNKQLVRARDLIARKEPGRRAKFIKKQTPDKNVFTLNESLLAKTEKLLGIKGYITNIPENVLSNDKVISYYHDLWHVEQAFRMSKTDLKTRPIFHQTHEAIKAHVLLCFMALMMGKFLEIKSGLSLRKVRDILWNVHEAHILDSPSGKSFTLQSNLDPFLQSSLHNFLKPH